MGRAGGDGGCRDGDWPVRPGARRGGGAAAGSRPVVDDDLLELAAVLRQRLGVRPRVEVRVAPGLTMPATVGWRRPLVLLPEDWTAWDDCERRVVLSHELAHIRRRDYLAGVWAQLSLCCRSTTRYAHWPARRLRLDQELAADAWGCALRGESDLPGDPRQTGLATSRDRSDGPPGRSLRPVARS